jgi:regulatory protein
MESGAPSPDPPGETAQRSGTDRRRATKPVSLRARALKLLARRDYSYLEMERRLAPHAANAAELGALLEDLQRLGWLSELRLAEQLMRKSAARYGARRVLEQLHDRGIGREVAAPLKSELQASELQRARAVWARRFGRLPSDLRERGRQARFLEQRGFDPDVIRRVLRGAAEE